MKLSSLRLLACLSLLSTHASLAQPNLVSAYNWFSPSRMDNALSIVWTPSSPDASLAGYGFPREEGRVFDPHYPQPLDTVAMDIWYSGGRGDYFSSTEPVWQGSPGEKRSPDYGWIMHQGYMFERALAGTVPLYHWFNPGFGDNLTTALPDWAPAGGLKGGYEPGLIQGYMYPGAARHAPVDPASFGFGTMKINGKAAYGTRPLLIVMFEYSDTRFTTAHNEDYYHHLAWGPGDRTIWRYFKYNSYGNMIWTDGGIIRVQATDDPATRDIDESKFADLLAVGDAVIQRQKTIQAAAAAGINFASFDANHDGRVTADELALVIINSDPIDWDCGQTAGTGPVSVSGVEVDILASAVSQSVGFATLAHEIGHTLGDEDIYGNPSINDRYSLKAGTCAGADVHEYFHYDPWHKMRLGWIEPRIFPLNYPGATAFLDAPQKDGWAATPDKRPILLYDPVRGMQEFFLLEYRTPTSGTANSYDADVPGTGLVVWAVHTNPDGLLTHVQKIMAGPDRVLQTRPAAGSDDMLVDWTPDPTRPAVPDVILAGPDLVLQTTAQPGSDDVGGLDDAMCMIIGRGSPRWGVGEPWRTGDWINLKYYDGTSAAATIRVGAITNGGNTIAVEWSRETQLLPRLDSLTVSSTSPSYLLTLTGMFPVNIHGYGEVYLKQGDELIECPVRSWGIRQIVAQVPHLTRAGDYEVVVSNGFIFGDSNRLPLRLDADVNTPPGEFQFSASDYSVNESAGAATITVNRINGSCGTAEVVLSLGNDGAVGGVDYVVGNRRLTFLEGETSKSVSISIIDDSLDEDDEFVRLTLALATGGATITGPNPVRLRIVDDDPMPTLSIGDVSVAEADNAAVNAVFTVTLSAPSGRTVTANYVTRDGTASSPGDYTAQSGQVIFAPGETTRQITIPVLPDQIHERDETFFVDLTDSTTATLGRSTGQAVILDNDPIPSLSVGNLVVTEGDSGIIHATFHLRLSAPSDFTVQFFAATVDDTALNGGDYIGVSGLVTIPAGETEALFQTHITAAPGEEPDETLRLHLSGPVNVVLPEADATLTIKELRVLSIERQGDDSILTFPTGNIGQRYHVERAENLIPNAELWVRLTPPEGILGTGEVATFRDTHPPEAMGFYRVSQAGP